MLLNIMSGTDKEAISQGPIKLDPKSFMYRGLLVRKDISEKAIGFFKEPMDIVYAPYALVSHEGDKDFSIFFSQYKMQTSEFENYLTVVFSYNEILNFLEAMKKRLEDKSDIQKTQKDNNDIKEPGEVISKGLTLTQTTNFFTPNRYLQVISNMDYQIFFGRLLGEFENKEMALFMYSIIMPIHFARNLITIIERNIKRFEEKHNINLNDLTLAAAKKKNEKGDTHD